MGKLYTPKTPFTVEELEAQLDQLRVGFVNDDAGMDFQAYIKGWIQTIHSEVDANLFLEDIAAICEMEKGRI
jgi:hypothetical protein